MATYMFLYWWIIPSLHYERPIYFDYTQSLPTSIINIDQEYEWYLFDLPFEYMQQQESSLKPNELYDISINLHIPFKQSMHDVGNVMLKLSLYSCTERDTNDYNQEYYQTSDTFQTKYGWNLLRKATRPILLKYESTMVRIIKKIICIIPYCLGLMKEERHLSIPIMTSFDEKFDDSLCAAVIQISSHEFNIYDASIYFDIQLQGVKYFLYHWWLTSGLLMMTIFTFICCLSSSPALICCCYQVNKLRDCTKDKYEDELFEQEEVQLHHDQTYNDDILDDLKNEIEEKQSSASTSSISLLSSSSITELQNSEELLANATIDSIHDQIGLRRRINTQE